MTTRLLLLLAITFACHAHAQLPAKPDPDSVTGTFLAYIDDHATLFLNGEKLFHGNLGTSRSSATELKVGYRVVVHLANDHGPKGFLLVFASSDGARIVSFRASDFKIVPENGVTNFTPEQFSKWPQAAKHLPNYKRDKAFDKLAKNYSQVVWGDLDQCTLACTITPQMISQRPK